MDTTTLDPQSLNIFGVQSLIGSKLNKQSGGVANQDEGTKGENIDVLDLSLDDDELLKLSKKWEVEYAPYETKIKIKQQANKTYYLGLQKEGVQANPVQTPVADNLIFEALETFIPAKI